MAFGGPGSWLLEVQWNGATYVDESAYLKAGALVTITRGRGTEAEDIQVGSMSGVLDNALAGAPTQLGRFTPDNPLSPLSPNVVDGVRCRFTVTRGTPSVRHRGRLALATPTLDDGDVVNAEVPFESVDAIATLAEREMRCAQVEFGLAASLLGSWDVWPFEVGTVADQLPNVGSGGGTAEVVPALTRVGSAALVQPEGILADGAVKVVAKDTVGPIVYLRTGIPTGSVNDVIIPFRTTDRIPGGGAQRYLAFGTDAAGEQLWSLRLNDNLGSGQTDLILCDGTGAEVGNLIFNFAPIGAEQGDDQWYAAWLFWNGTNTSCLIVRVIDDTIVSNAGYATIDVRRTRDVYLGGLASRRARRKHTRCVSAQYGPVVIGVAAGNVGTAYLSPAVQEDDSTRVFNLAAHVGVGRTTVGARSRQVRITPTSGRTPFDAIAEVCRTIGATAVSSLTADDNVRYLRADQLRQPTVALTLDADLHLDGGAGIQWAKGAGPASVEATFPGGKVTYSDPTRQQRTTQVDVAALDNGMAREAASALVNTARRLRIERLTIDLAGAADDLWSSVMALEVGARIRVTLGTSTSNLAKHYGYTYLDVYVLGWVEEYGEGVARWTLDTIPADDPVRGKFDTGDIRGKFAARPGTMTGTSGTYLGTTTAGGTLVITTTAGQPTLTTNAGAYPLLLVHGGEAIRIDNPPASSTSPQTVTVAARAQLGTIARAHLAGEAVNVALPAAFGQ